MSGSAVATFKVAIRADDPLLRDCVHVQAGWPIDAPGAMFGAEHTARPLVWHGALPRDVSWPPPYRLGRSRNLGLAADRLARRERRQSFA
jgi:hypothetical protein